MLLSDALKLARSLMADHGLAGWQFGFNSARRRMGLCVYPSSDCPGRIELSAHYCKGNSDDDIRDTILHEIAHALAGPGTGHGPKWKAICLQIGAKPMRCGYAEMPKGKWRALCPTCKTEHRLSLPRVWDRRGERLFGGWLISRKRLCGLSFVP